MQLTGHKRRLLVPYQDRLFHTLLASPAYTFRLKLPRRIIL